MYPLFETLCIDNGHIRNVEWHCRRFETSYSSLYRHCPTYSLLDNTHIPSEYCKGRFRLRISYNESSTKTEIESYITKDITRLKVWVVAPSFDYSLKYTDRSVLNYLFSQRGDCDDVLIIKDGMVTDTSVCNIVFFDGQKWITPSTPLLCGTARARLLADGTIEERPVAESDIHKFEAFRLINALRHFDTVATTTTDNIIDF